MMKRKFLAVVLPIVGCATVVGSGFSAWYFGSGIEGERSLSTGVNVTEEIKTNSKSLSVSTDDTTIASNDNSGVGAVVLDQGGPKNVSLDSGIMFGTTADKETIDTRKATEKDGGVTYSNNLKWVFKVSYDGSPKTAEENDNVAFNGLNLGQIYQAGMRLKITASIEITGVATSFIEFKDNNDTAEGLQTLTVLPNSNVANCEKTLYLNYEKTDSGENKNKLTGDYILSEDLAKKYSTIDTTDWTFTLDLDTEKKENGDYSNHLLKWKKTKESEEPDAKLVEGKPTTSEQYNDMVDALTKSETANEVVFSVTAHIEEDPTK